LLFALAVPQYCKKKRKERKMINAKVQHCMNLENIRLNAKRRKPVMKTHIIRFHLHKISRLGRVMETDKLRKKRGSRVFRGEGTRGSKIRL
jgi:hypothetical protein